MVVGALSQIYVGGDESAPEAVVAPSFGAELGQILLGLGETVLETGRRLVSLIPGIDLLAADKVAEDTALSSALQTVFSPLAAFAFLVFVLLYVPCIATIGAIKQEFGWRWAATSAVYQTAAAWLLAVLVFQGGRFLGFG